MARTHYPDIQKTLPHLERPIPHAKNIPTLEEAVAHINNIDFSLIANKLCSNDPLVSHYWSKEELDVGIQYYRNFLYLNKKYLNTFPVLPPMLEVDEIWHHHILDTHKYVMDCDQIFGYYFHHYPYFGTRGHQDRRNLNHAFNIVQLLHKHEFGFAMQAIWIR